MISTFVVPLLQSIVAAVSPQIRELVVELAERAREGAKETENDFDDLLANILVQALAAGEDEQARKVGTESTVPGVKGVPDEVPEASTNTNEAPEQPSR